MLGNPKRAGGVAGPIFATKSPVPFATAIQGGEVQLSVAHPSGQAETLSVKIPAGIEDGKKIRLRGQGEPAPRGGPAGDLILTVHVAPHPCFRRSGKHTPDYTARHVGRSCLGSEGRQCPLRKARSH